ncbi:MAG: hypothetical protein IPN43_02185 [Chitinophagaceae bacterium]|nr:hypothetical protein [Chitinophagaceae bacterium]
MVDHKNKIAIIVGAGAVENAWNPILQIFNPMMQGGVDSDTANCIFARMIYLLRVYSDLSDEKSVENLKNQIGIVQDLKILISELIQVSQTAGILKPRKEFKGIFTKFILADKNNLFGLVSTNWDTVIDKYADELVKKFYVDLDSITCFHIHGSIDDPHHLYLPSEISREKYRSTEDNDKHGYNHYATLKFLKEAHQIILYGLSLDPLDAELSQILNSAFTTSTNLREVVVINPDFKKVRNRIKSLLFPKTHLTVKCFHPQNLENEV